MFVCMRLYASVSICMGMFVSLLQVSSSSAMPSFAVLKHIKFPYNILSFHVSVHIKVLLKLA